MKKYLDEEIELSKEDIVKICSAFPIIFGLNVHNLNYYILSINF